MRSLILVVLCTLSLHASEETEKAIRVREYGAQAYADGNVIKKDASLDILFQRVELDGPTIQGKTILDIECGIGEVARVMADHAEAVHGIDSKQELIEYAQDKHLHSEGTLRTAIRCTESKNNLSFECCSVEDFKTQKRYQMAIALFCLHFMEDKHKVFTAINKKLQMGGEFVGTINTTSNPPALDLQVFLEMIPAMKDELPFLNEFNMQEHLGCSWPTDKELENLISANGFHIVTYKPHYKREYTITREGLENFMWPIIIGRPAIKQVPRETWEALFSKYIDCFLTKLEQDKNGYYILPIIDTTLFHLVKVAER